MPGLKSSGLKRAAGCPRRRTTAGRTLAASYSNSDDEGVVGAEPVDRAAGEVAHVGRQRDGRHVHDRVGDLTRRRAVGPSAAGRRRPRRRPGDGTRDLPSRRAAVTAMPCAARSVTRASPAARRRAGRCWAACRGSGRRARCRRRAGRDRRALRAVASAACRGARRALTLPLPVEQPGVVERGVQQRLHLLPVVRRALADDRRPTRRRRARRTARPARRSRPTPSLDITTGMSSRREPVDARDALLARVLAHAHEARVAGDLDRPAVAEHVPERDARPAAAREEREQGEVLGARRPRC